MSLAWTDDRKALHLEIMATPERQDIQKKVAKAMGEANGHPVVVNGILYPSKTAACRALNIYPAALSKLLKT
jgi:hypothetical protein